MLLTTHPVSHLDRRRDEGRIGSRGRILVVDDVGPQRDAVVAALRSEGFEVDEATSGAEALVAARRMAPDAVVLDFGLSAMDGGEVHRQLRGVAPAGVPVMQLRSVAASGADGLDDPKLAPEGYLTYPVDPRALGTAVSTLVRLKRQQDERAAESAVAALLHDALDALEDHVALLGPDSKVVAVNHAWAEFAKANGFAGDATGLGTNYCDTCDRATGPGADDARRASAGIRRVIAGDVPSFDLEYPCDSPDTQRWFCMTVRAMPRSGPVVALVTHSDRTREHAAARAEVEARASLERERTRLEAIFEEAPAFLAVLSGPDYVFERTNPAYRQLVGHDRSVGKPVLEALPELRGQGFIELLDRVRETGEPFNGVGLPVRLARSDDGMLDTRYVDMVYQRLVDADGGYSILVQGVDVTDRVVAGETLRRTEQQLRDQFAKMPVPTFLWEGRGDDFDLIDLNEAAATAMPRLAAGAAGGRGLEFFPGMQEIRAEMTRSLRDRVVVHCAAEMDLGPTGGRRQFELTIGPQLPDRVLVHAVDITGRTELEAQLRQAQKMDAIGRLAGGVAHDFNNLLTVISAHSGFLLESLAVADPQREDAEAIHGAAMRAAGLTRQLLAFSRKQLLKPVLLDLNATVEATRGMLIRLLGEDIEIAVELASGLGVIVADGTQVDQVIVNLAVNARDAMPDGGRLTIRTRNAPVVAVMSGTRRVVPPGEYVLLEVEDTGVGMGPAVLARLFEPFFTTKAVGQGTGLGLATAYGIVKQSGGYILAESAPGAGATFQIYFPLASPETATAMQRVAEAASVRGVETVLLIEDEDAVRAIAKRLLRRQGYVVLEATNGAEAMAIAAAYAAPIHLVVTDAVMPGIGGAEAVRRLREARPGLRALLMSGYTDDEITRRGMVTSAFPFIQKPFVPGAFASAVRDALDA